MSASAVATESFYGPYRIVDHLGKGTFGEVFLAQKDDQYYAIKFCSEKLSNAQLGFKLLRKQSKLLRKLKHENIIRLHHPYAQDQMIFQTKQCLKGAIVLEYAPNNLIDMIVHTPFPQKIARVIFKQLINAIAYLHRHMILHRDIKPQNILFDQNFVLKICDFGLSAHIAGEEKGKAQCGTNAFMTPQMLYGQPQQHNGIMNDLFASGVTLFMLVTGQLPFHKANPSELPYSLLVRNKHEDFWKQFQKDTTEFSNDFKNLVCSMLALDPTHRLSLAQIYGHCWLQGQTASPQYYSAYMHRLKQNILSRLSPKIVSSTIIQTRSAPITINLPKIAYQPRTSRISDIMITALNDIIQLQAIFQPLNAEMLVKDKGIILLVMCNSKQSQIQVGLTIFSVNSDTDCLRLSLIQGSLQIYTEFIKSVRDLFHYNHQQ